MISSPPVKRHRFLSECKARVGGFVAKNAVLVIAAALALASCLLVPPDAEYLGYIDFRTLAILFSLMTVMTGLRGQGVFDWLGRALLSHTRTTFQLTAVLVGLCFFRAW